MDNFDQKKNNGTPKKASKPKGQNSQGGHPRRQVGTAKPVADAPLIGSRDILATPEILSPHLSLDDTQTEARPAKSQRRRTGKGAQSAQNSRSEKDTGNEPAAKEGTARRGRKKSTASETVPEAPAPAKTGKSTGNRKGTSSRNSRPQATDTPTESRGSTKSETWDSTTNRRSNSQGRGGRRSGAPTVVSAEDSIIHPAHILRHEDDAPRGKTAPSTVLKPIPKAKLRIIPLGGLNEVGKNMTVVEYGDDIIIIDCGLGFPDEDEMPGIDLVIPDVTYLENNRDRIRGMVLTHGHEDHIGAIPYVLQKIDVPIYGTRLTLGIIENKLQEHTLPWKADLRCVSAGDVIRLGASFTVEFIRVNHSIADACALAINTPLGMLVHTGDFKLDLTPIEGEMMNLTRFGELGREGVLLLMCESTNAERPGHTPSEKIVGRSLEMIFTMNTDKRIVIATFSSNVHRVQQIIDISARHGRKVAVTGRSMINIVSAATELGYMKVPDGVLIDINDIKRYRPEELTLITTGSQGEHMSALYRMAFGDHSQVSLGLSDLVVLSASAIPGNEKLVNRIVNELAKIGVRVINDDAVEVHVSGHACQEELKLVQGLTKPRYFMPVHGEYKHMAANRELAISMGVASDHIFISDIGKILEIDEKGARFAGTVPSGIVLIDGLGVGDVGNIVLRDRKHLSQDGLIVVVATVDANAGMLVSGPDIVSRGFVYVRESEELMEEVRRIAADAINQCLLRSNCDWYEIKNRVKDDITRYLYSRTKRKPMILPIVMDV